MIIIRAGVMGGAKRGTCPGPRAFKGLAFKMYIEKYFVWKSCNKTKQQYNIILN